MTNGPMRVAFSIVLLAIGLAFAQVDDRARELLESLNPEGRVIDIATLDQTITMTMYQGGDELVTTTRMVIDYAGQRAAAVNEVMGMSTTMVHRDGATVMKMNGMTPPPSPPTTARSATPTSSPASRSPTPATSGCPAPASTPRRSAGCSTTPADCSAR